MLGFRFGDGAVYLPQPEYRSTLDLAIREGFVSEEGYVTRRGRALLADFNAD
ncbi:MAG: hypothetical protein AB7Q97_07275 [Gammaproteobacteria bacterium]